VVIEYSYLFLVVRKL